MNGLLILAARWRRRLARLLVVAVVAATMTVAASTPTAGPAAAADDTDSIRLWTPPAATAYPQGRHHVWVDLGVRAIAQGAPFEIRSTRASYDDPIVTVWHTDAGDVTLPRWTMVRFGALRRFLHVTVTPRSGGPSQSYYQRACLGEDTSRVDPAADAHTPYPTGCWMNPYALGEVQGIQQGWASRLTGYGRRLQLDPGRYVVTVAISPAYVRVLGLDPAAASGTIRLRVPRSGADCRVCEAARMRVPGDVARPSTTAGPAGVEQDAPTGPVPDLRALPAWNIGLNKAGTVLTFSATVWNAGTSPLVVDGFRREGEDLMDAYQYFFDSDGDQTGYTPVGEMEWDARPSHQHWHFEDFARYSLLDADRNQVARSKKEAFCLANTDAVDLTGDGAAWQPDNMDLATSCGDLSALSVREVLAAGWGDTYMQYRAGQAFRIGDLPNGVYYISVAANPRGALVESDTGNNTALRRIRLTGHREHRRVHVSQVGLVATERYGGVG